jgi:hypothetical protein
MAHDDAREGKWMRNWRMEWVASTLHTTSEHGVSGITNADVHTSAASSRLNWRPRRFKWTRPFRRKTKSCSCACVITYQLACTNVQAPVYYTVLPVSSDREVAAPTSSINPSFFLFRAGKNDSTTAPFISLLSHRIRCKKTKRNKVEPYFEILLVKKCKIYLKAGHPVSPYIYVPHFKFLSLGQIFRKPGTKFTSLTDTPICEVTVTLAQRQ